MKFLASFTTALLAASPALAQVQQIPPSPLAAAEAIERARTAIVGGDLVEAESLLATVAINSETQNDLDFLSGTIAFEKKDYNTVISRFRELLARNPSLNRVRLDLARAYFMKGDDKAAEYHFRAAEAQGVPPGVQRSIDTFLDAIRRRKRWESNISVAVAPDTNINAATTAQSVDVYGLPFAISNDARQTSGVGLMLNLGTSYQWDIADNTKWKVGGGYYGTEYTHSEFSDRQITGYTGPRFLLGEGSEVSVLGTASRRWFGDVPLTYGVGGRVEGRTTLSPRFILDGAIAGQELHYNAERYSAYTGPVASISAGLTYALDPSSFIRGGAGVTREQTALAAFRDHQYAPSLGYYRENLPYRFAVYVGAQATFIRYDAALAAFGVVRKDTEVSYRLSLSNKYIDFKGFTPVISYVHTDRYSNIAFYSYHRDHGEIGVTQNF
jgi:outer membrane protein